VEKRKEKLMNAVDLLRRMVTIPSFSREEGAVADLVEAYIAEAGLEVKRVGNNIIARVECGVPGARTLLLNSHLDTVRPSAGYTFDPFSPHYDEKTVWGLGSNDAGGAAVAMLHAALHFHRNGGIGYDLVLLLAAEEEITGDRGTGWALPHAGRIDCAIVGEPTRMQAAIAERGLLVLDALAEGQSGHAARGEGINALYKAMDDIQILRNHRFERTSPLMGEVKLTVTQIEAGTQHNVVPDKCCYVIDIRPTDRYTPTQILDELRPLVGSRLTPRSLANKSSATPSGHPLLLAAEALGIPTFVSPTTSDWMVLGEIPALKMGPGDSARSHTPDEYIHVAELLDGIDTYIALLKELDRLVTMQK
jgi:acetylornithine deacetylase